MRLPLLGFSGQPLMHDRLRYPMSQLTAYFHMVPRVDINFQPVNATFDPKNNIYLESLGILVALPGIWLIFTLFAFLIFFLCRCCDSNAKKKKKITPLKWILSLFALLCCGALSIGLFGNDQAHQAMTVVQGHANEMQSHLGESRNASMAIEQALDSSIRDDVDRLSVSFSVPLPNATVRSMVRDSLNQMRSSISQSLAKTKDVNIKMKAFDMDEFPKWLDIVEFFRWPGTIALLCGLILICLLLLWGVIRHSRCLLILFSVLGLLSVVLCWVLVSAYFGITVAASDFCFDPHPFFTRVAATNEDERVAIEYYMMCEDVTENPFKKDIVEGQRAIQDLQTSAKFLKGVADQYLPQREVHTLLHSLEMRLGDSERYISQMANLVDCTTIQNRYLSAMEAICVAAFEGTVLMLASAIASGLLFTILIWTASHTWIHIRSRENANSTKRRQDHVDDEGRPFIPVGTLTRGGGGSRNMYETVDFTRNSIAISNGGSHDTKKAIHKKKQQPGLPSKSNARLAYLYDVNNFFPQPAQDAASTQEPHAPLLASQRHLESSSSQGNGREDQAFLHARYTPPPAYDHLTSSTRHFQMELPSAPMYA